MTFFKILLAMLMALGPLAALITNKGKEITVDRILGSGTEPKYIGWGTGSGQTAASTDLAAAAAESRTNGTSSKVTTTTTNDTYQVTGLITATATRAITEVALFDAATVGNMFVYADFSVINLATSDTITFTIKTKYS